MGWFENMGWFEWIVVGQLSFLIILMSLLIILMVVMAYNYWEFLTKGIDFSTQRVSTDIVSAIDTATEELQSTMNLLDEKLGFIKYDTDAMRVDIGEVKRRRTKG